MNEEEIEKRIIICEQREKGYLEVGKTKIADKYSEEKRKWELLLNRLNPKRGKELDIYKKGYFNLKQALNEIRENIVYKIKENELLIEQLADTGSFRIGNAQSKIKDYKELLQIIDKVLGGSDEWFNW